MESKQT